jgi:hypothetical protein
MRRGVDNDRFRPRLLEGLPNVLGNTLCAAMTAGKYHLDPGHGPALLSALIRRFVASLEARAITKEVPFGPTP